MSVEQEVGNMLSALFVGDKILESISQEDLKKATISFMENFLSDGTILFSESDVSKWMDDLRSNILNEALMSLQEKGLIDLSVDDSGEFIFSTKD